MNNKEKQYLILQKVPSAKVVELGKEVNNMECKRRSQLQKSELQKCLSKVVLNIVHISYI